MESNPGANLREYRVKWVIDLDATSPEEAAREARRMQRDPNSEVGNFTVRRTRPGRADKVRIDLDLLDQLAQAAAPQIQGQQPVPEPVPEPVLAPDCDVDGVTYHAVPEEAPSSCSGCVAYSQVEGSGGVRDHRLCDTLSGAEPFPCVEHGIIWEVKPKPGPEPLFTQEPDRVVDGVTYTQAPDEKASSCMGCAASAISAMPLCGTLKGSCLNDRFVWVVKPEPDQSYKGVRDRVVDGVTYKAVPEDGRSCRGCEAAGNPTLCRNLGSSCVSRAHFWVKR